jgi:hypothetical protein
MTQDNSFRMSQGYDVLPPKPGKAYPIPCEEWNYLKEKLRDASDKPDFYHTGGSLLLGAMISTLIAILTGAFQGNNNIIAWAVVVVTTICGCLALFFACERRKVSQTKVSDILKQMELIERRYQDKEGS